MKNTLKVLSVRVFGIIAIVAVFTFSAATCSGGGGKTINSPEALKEYLDRQPANSPDKPINVSMGANELMLPKIRNVLNSAGKYVSLNLTGSALTTIPEDSFKNCKTLVGVTIPKSVTRIESDAFKNCDGLSSVTFQGTISPDNFNDSAFPRVGLGTLRFHYLREGPGTYKIGGMGWEKQQVAQRSSAKTYHSNPVAYPLDVGMLYMGCHAQLLEPAKRGSAKGACHPNSVVYPLEVGTLYMVVSASYKINTKVLSTE